jgi:hypothetical protein
MKPPVRGDQGPLKDCRATDDDDDDDELVVRPETHALS